MEQTKKLSFILYHEQREIFEKLSNEQAGILIKAIFDYEVTGAMPELEGLLEIAMIPIRQNLDRNKEKYMDIVEKRKLAGSKGGKQRVANQANATFAKNKIANQADNDNVNVNDNVNDNDNSSSSEEILKEDEEFSLTKEDEELLIKFAKEKNNIKYPRPWLRKLAKNGDTTEVLERAKSWQKILKKKEEEKIEENKKRIFEEITPEEQQEEERQIKEIQQRIRAKLNTLCKPIKNL